MRKLPVGDTISHAVRSTLHNLAFAIHISWPWMVFLLPVYVAGNLYILANPPAGPDEFNPKTAAVGALVGLLNAIPFASIAVSWHRYILLDEIPQGLQRLRVDGTVLRYFGNVLLVALALFFGGALAGVAAFLLIAILGKASVIFLIPAGIALVMALIVYFYRLSIKLPAVALGRRDYTFGRALEDTRGNFWQIFGVAILFALLLLALALALLVVALILAQLGTAGAPLSIIIEFVVNWVATFLAITMLTSLYGFFAEGRSF
jgi:hypothetical protein